jgi:phosphoserine aminotransferase
MYSEQRICKYVQFQAFSQHSPKEMKKIIQNTVKTADAKADNTECLPNTGQTHYCYASLLSHNSVNEILHVTSVQETPHCCHKKWII